MAKFNLLVRENLVTQVRTSRLYEISHDRFLIWDGEKFLNLILYPCLVPKAVMARQPTLYLTSSFKTGFQVSIDGLY